MADATYHFLSFVRRGFAGAVTQPDTLGAGQPAVATAPVSIDVSGVADPVARTVAVRGPGDVLGLSATQVVRTDPIDGAVGVEPNYFAQIELDRPDLPWIVTPAAASGERLRPWLVLVVLETEGEHASVVRPGSPLPHVLVSQDASDQLPDLADSHLWVHAQVLTPDGQSIAAAVDGDPRLSVSRLLCPRHLAPNTSYVAAVVPAFAVGRSAGLGLPVTPADEARLDPSWTAGQAVDLPVYHSWRFRTGEDADFESLARRLQGRPLPAGVGVRSLDVSRPGAGLASIDPPTATDDVRAVEWLEGALRAVDSDDLPARDAAAATAWRASLTVLLDRPADLLAAGDLDPVVAPPIYGDHHALVFRLDAGTPPPWLSELNLSAPDRVAAGLGTRAVQVHQDDFVARAWQQLGDVLDANRLLRGAQLARTTGLTVHARLAGLDAAATLAVTAPVHDRALGVLDVGATVTRSVAASRLPSVAATPAFRRLGRAGAATRIVARYADEVFHAPADGADGATTLRSPGEVLGAAAGTALLVQLDVAGAPAPDGVEVLVSTLDQQATMLPEPAALAQLAGAARRDDVGASGVVASLGAVPAAAVAALIDAATTATITPPPHQPPPHLPPVHLPPVHTQPTHLAPRLPSGSVLVPTSGAGRHLGGVAVLTGDTVTVDTDRVRQVSTGTIRAAALDDTRFGALVAQDGVPARTVTADPVLDPGARLDAVRTDPAALTALAAVATGDLAASLTLDRLAATQVTSGAAATALTQLLGGTFSPVLPPAPAPSQDAADVAATAELLAGAAGALAAMVTVADAPPPPDGPALALAGARTGLLAALDPAHTVATRVAVRVSSLVRPGTPPRDDLDPILACPVYQDPLWTVARDLDPAWLLPGLDLVPPDTATLVRTNPAFVAAYLVGSNHELMRELLWREFPTDQRGTGFRRFWGRTGDQPDDIGPVHRFAGGLADNLLAGQHPEAVLLLRSELLRRYPGSLVYLSRAHASGADIALDDDTLVLPTFRGDLPPDVTFVGFPIAVDELRAAGDPWFFVIAQPPSEPRFGLDDAAADTPAVPATSDDLAWSHVTTDGTPTGPAPFATADPPALRGHALDGGLHWGDSAAVQAHLTYQHPVRVAIRAADLLPPDPGGTA